jgi:DNA modification methylase
MADDSVDIVVTSPPYNTLGKRIPQTPTGLRKGSQWLAKIREIGYSDDMPEPDYQMWLRAIVNECLRVSKGLVWVNHKVRYRDGEAVHPVRFLPFPLYQEIVWDRRGGYAFNCQRFCPSHEGIWGFGRPHWWNRKSNKSLSVWNLKRPPEVKCHPCAFPIDLPARCIEASCPPDGIVMDPFSGSGSTGIAAVGIGRNYIGIEKRADYAKSSRARLREAECVA